MTSLFTSVKLIRNISAILLALIFLVPAAGFYFNKHICLNSGESFVQLDNMHSCCAEDLPAQRHSEQSPAQHCCSNPGENSFSTEILSEDCCTNEGKYLNLDEKYTSPEKIKLPYCGFHDAIATLSGSYESFSMTDLQIREYSHSPPISISSKHILIRQGVLLI
jgi:hypothetical protein